MADKSAVERVADGANQGLDGSHPAGAPGDGVDQAAADLFRTELDLFEGSTIAPPKRGRGRPPGSANRSTLKLQQHLMVQGYRDPAEFLASIMTMNTAELARELSCDKADALPMQIRAAESLMPYFHQKLPTAIHIKPDDARPMIVMSDTFNMQVNQTLSVEAAKGSHGERSHSVSQVIDMSGESDD